MAAPLRIALCQLDLVVGDIAGNEKKIIEGLDAARSEGAQLVLVPELAVTGYPPEDLLLKEHFLLDARAALERIAGQTQGIVALVGFPELAEDVYNACGVLAEGEVKAIYRKVYLPNYGVFDEERYFQSGSGGATIELGEHLVVGLTVCEDIWEPGPPASEEALAGATLLVNISASPYHAGKGLEREQMLAQRARDNLAVVAFCGLVGGQDELVFDGHSLVIDHEGEVIARGGQFSEELLVATIDPDASRASRLRDPRHRPALRHSQPNAPLLARLNLPAAPSGEASGGRVEPLELPIEEAMQAYDDVLGAVFDGRPADLTEENIQARIRGNLLMALSNKFDWLVLTTGNKSEMAVGYSTLYGDTAGGFAVIKDCPKTLVYELARHRNELAAPREGPIPQTIIDRAPSAELRPDQRDEDSLPPYPVLDPILEGYVAGDLGREQLILRGFDADDVDRVIAMVDRAEYKRRQAPPGIKITTKAFGRDRRMPITNRYRG